MEESNEGRRNLHPVAEFRFFLIIAIPCIACFVSMFVTVVFLFKGLWGDLIVSSMLAFVSGILVPVAIRQEKKERAEYVRWLCELESNKLK